MRGREGERKREGFKTLAAFLSKPWFATAYPPLFFLDLKESASNRKVIPRDYAVLLIFSKHFA